MNIRCRSCRHSEETSLGFFVKLIGGALPVGGYWAWVAYLFAGTGFAMPIVIAIITGGVAMVLFKNEIVQWITNRGHSCPKCGNVNWEAYEASAHGGDVTPKVVNPGYQGVVQKPEWKEAEAKIRKKQRQEWQESDRILKEQAHQREKEKQRRAEEEKRS